MQIHQLSVHYTPAADRLLLRVNTRDGQQFAVWLTRRLTLRLWPHLATIVPRLAVQNVAPNATVLPEAQAMLAQTARERTLRTTDFATPFDAKPAAQPLGAEPLLATEIELAPQPGGTLRLTIVDADKRRVQLQLTEQLATAVKELVQQALTQADWGWVPQAPAEASDAAPRVLN